MHIPVVTDQMLGKIIPAAHSPVFVEFFVTGPEWVVGRKALERVAGLYDQRVIFLRVGVEENPTCAHAVGMVPGGFVIYRGGEPIGSSCFQPDEVMYADALNALLKGRT